MWSLPNRVAGSNFSVEMIVWQTQLSMRGSDNIMKPEAGFITGNSECLSQTLPTWDRRLPEGKSPNEYIGDKISQTTEILCWKIESSDTGSGPRLQEGINTSYNMGVQDEIWMCPCDEQHMARQKTHLPFDSMFQASTHGRHFCSPRVLKNGKQSNWEIDFDGKTKWV